MNEFAQSVSDAARTCKSDRVRAWLLTLVEQDRRERGDHNPDSDPVPAGAGSATTPPHTAGVVTVGPGRES
jgi:hypothetical protein